MSFHTLPRLFLQTPLSAGASVTLDKDQAHYLATVMRVNSGDEVRIFNGADGEWLARAEVSGSGKKISVSLSPQKQLRLQITEPDLWLCCAPIKRAHFEFMVEKATELGVRHIQPVLTQRTQVRDVNIERMTSIITEAAEQSERLTVPTIAQPVALEQLVKNWDANRVPVVCAEFGDAAPVGSALTAPNLKPQPATIITGPEGGFTPDEMALLHTMPHCIAVRLGPRILRADTAAIAALTCWQAQCGDW